MKSLKNILTSYIVEEMIADVLFGAVISLLALQNQRNPSLVWTLIQILAGCGFLVTLISRIKGLAKGFALWGGTGMIWDVDFREKATGDLLESKTFITHHTKTRTLRLLTEYADKKFGQGKASFRMSQLSTVPAIAVKARTVAGANREQLWIVDYGQLKSSDTDHKLIVLAPNVTVAKEAAKRWAYFLSKSKIRQVVAGPMNLHDKVDVMIPRYLKEGPTR